MNRIQWLLLTACLLSAEAAFPQGLMNDEALRYQQQRMVFLQWDQNKFLPRHGFLWLNPYYWLTWGLFYPNYHQTDLRPLSASGPQTQRLALTAAMNSTDDAYRMQSDTLGNSARSAIAAQSGLLSAADPLWLLYYQHELSPVLEHPPAGLLSGLSAQVSAKLISEGTLAWYLNALDRLAERLQAARSADMDRGSRILTYQRLLLEYRKTAAVWSARIAGTASGMAMASHAQHLKNNQVSLPAWTPQTDIDIAEKIIQHIQ